MNIREIAKPVTAKTLNESLAKRFGKKIALEDFTLEQLQDVRNKIRTTLSQVETNESFDVTTSESYQKNRLFMDVLTAEIAERSDIAEAKPDFLDMDKDGDKEEPMKKAIKDKETKEAFATEDGNQIKTKEEAVKSIIDTATSIKGGMAFVRGAMATRNLGRYPNYSDQGFIQAAEELLQVDAKLDNLFDKNAATTESIIREGAEDQAELVMAAKEMVNRVTGWLEDTAEMQTESMLELADAIRDEMGQEQSDAFVTTVKAALEELYTTMEGTRTALTSGVGLLTGEGEPVDTMGADPEMDAEVEPEMEPTVDQETEVGDEFGAGEAAVGGEEEAGREKRESVQRTSKKQIAERSRRLGNILSKKK